MMTICLLGASGSIGSQTLEIIANNQQDFDLIAFSLGKRVRKISGIIKKHPHIKAITIQDKNKLKYYQRRFQNINFFAGDEGLEQLIEYCHPQMVVNALVGFVGLKPTLCALKKRLIVCLANKESLVVGGELINDLLSRGYGKLLPIDSEHVAVMKCLKVDDENIDKVYITASGGAFRNLSREQLQDVTAEQALCHPNWKMGKKITIDSATMVNKAFEIIEAHYLFGLEGQKILPIINIDSFIHALVRYNNGTVRLEMGKPDMRKPIKYALYQGLTPYQTIVYDDLKNIKDHLLLPFDQKRFPIVEIAYEIIEKKGTLGAVFNAANEVAVYAFLENKISFLQIEEIINRCIKQHQNIAHPTYEQIAQVDCSIRQKVYSMIKEMKQ